MADPVYKSSLFQKIVSINFPQESLGVIHLWFVCGVADATGNPLASAFMPAGNANFLNDLNDINMVSGAEDWSAQGITKAASQAPWSTSTHIPQEDRFSAIEAPMIQNLLCWRYRQQKAVSLGHNITAIFSYFTINVSGALDQGGFHRPFIIFGGTDGVKVSALIAGYFPPDHPSVPTPTFASGMGFGQGMLNPQRIDFTPTQNEFNIVIQRANPAAFELLLL